MPVVVMGRASLSSSAGDGGGSGSDSSSSSAGRSRGNNAGGRTGRRCRSSRSRGWLVSAHAADTRDGDIMSVYLESEVLEGVAVLDRPGGVRLCQLENTRVLAHAVVLNGTLANLGHVEETVQEISRPVEVGRSVGDSPAVAAHALERTAELV